MLRDSKGRFVDGHSEPEEWRLKKSLALKGKRPNITLSPAQECLRRSKISATSKGKPKPTLRKVTPELEAELKRLYTNGVLIKDIAQNFDLTWYTVREYVKPEYRQRRLQHQSIRRQRNFEARVARTAKELNEWEKGWLSGLIDGEGTLYFSKTIKANSRGFHVYLTKLQIVNSNRELLEEVKKVIGVGWIGEHPYIDKKGNRKPIYRYEAGANVMRWLLPQVNLIVKRRQKEIVLEALNLLRQTAYVVDASEEHSRLDQLRLEMRQANHRGV